MSKLRSAARICSISSGFEQRLVARRHLTSTASLQMIRIEKEEGFAVLHMLNKPVNSFSPAFTKEMTAAVLELEKDPYVNGLIFTSAVPRVFCAGLDLTQLYQKSREEIMSYRGSVMEYFLTHYSTSLVTIAAMNGHTVAGGAIMALLSDYRIMADGPYTIGVVEAKRNIVLTNLLRILVTNTIGPREAERAIQLGLAYRPEDALRARFVDEVVDEDKVLDRAREEMKNWLKIPNATRVTCKQHLRGSLIDLWKETAHKDNQEFADLAVTKDLQDNLERFFEKKR